ncbi:ArsR/SmtB family transcription factor [Burkholderia vietnamiensis]|uniref:ArsR/SmtB family transcription factor n=1 Tax=Burkholderia vietnamiensis TaxID=60552 RepID=UPI000D787C5D|nr:helix-turn-helix transcriptional regulator [Burkholderia vietnamiensis]GBH24970.1 transcriptional regulator [Burkholderia vietnamiensis]
MTDQDDHHFPGLSRIGALPADPGRAAMLWVLMDGSARPAGELTMIAGLAPSAASAHLARLTDSGLPARDIRGRPRDYRLASGDVAASLEALANVARAAAPNRPVPPPSRTVPAELRYARTCYDHMAGELAVRIFDGLTARGWLHANGDAIETTDAGAHALARWGIDVAQQRAGRRRFACGCLDWSERRAHLGGALGAALPDSFCTHGGIERTARPRVLRVTVSGQRVFDDWLTSA